MIYLRLMSKNKNTNMWKSVEIEWDTGGRSRRTLLDSEIDSYLESIKEYGCLSDIEPASEAAIVAEISYRDANGL